MCAEADRAMCFVIVARGSEHGDPEATEHTVYRQQVNRKHQTADSDVQNEQLLNFRGSDMISSTINVLSALSGILLILQCYQ